MSVSVLINEQMDEKINACLEEQDATMDSMHIELDNYLQVRDRLNTKMGEKIDAIMDEQDLEAALEAETEVETSDDEPDSPASTGSAGHPHRLDAPAGHLARSLQF